MYERHGAAPSLAECGRCELVLALPAARGTCPRCGATVERRKPDSLARTTAFLIAAALLYIPANAYPVLVTRSLSGTDRSTILGGVVELLHDGSWPLALLVFFASVTVPLLKMIGLAVLVITSHRRSSWAPLSRARLYRLIAYVGRWSMLDVFVVGLLVGLVQLQSLASTEAGPGALAFAAVVILTMLATESFDPRLIWDFRENPRD